MPPRAATKAKGEADVARCTAEARRGGSDNASWTRESLCAVARGNRTHSRVPIRVLAASPPRTTSHRLPWASARVWGLSRAEGSGPRAVLRSRPLTPGAFLLGVRTPAVARATEWDARPRAGRLGARSAPTGTLERQVLHRRWRAGDRPTLLVGLYTDPSRRLDTDAVARAPPRGRTRPEARVTHGHLGHSRWTWSPSGQGQAAGQRTPRPTGPHPNVGQKTGSN